MKAELNPVTEKEFMDFLGGIWSKLTLEERTTVKQFYFEVLITNEIWRNKLKATNIPTPATIEQKESQVFKEPEITEELDSDFDSEKFVFAKGK